MAQHPTAPLPSSEKYDRLLLRVCRWTFPSAFVMIHIVGMLELIYNIWLSWTVGNIDQKCRAQRRIWTDQVKGTSTEPKNRRRVAIVTGGNTGLGLEIAKALVEAGYQTVIACRSPARAKEAIEKVAAETGAPDLISTLPLDLSSFADVQSFVKMFITRFGTLDVLVNNAGVMGIPFALSKDKFEMQFAVNHLGHHILTMGLLPLLNQSPEGGRIIVLSSVAAIASDPVPYKSVRPDPDSDLPPSDYSPYGFYSHSKLANLLFVKALSRRLREAHSSVAINAIHPGLCRTELFRTYPRILSLLYSVVARFLRSPAQGAHTAIYLALAPEAASISGEYFYDLLPKPTTPHVKDQQVQDEFWAKTVEYTGADLTL